MDTLIYSKKLMRFIHEIKSTVKNIITHEIGLKVVGERFYNRFRQCSYPIQVVIYNDRSLLGYFDSNFFEMGFHERLMHSSREQLHQVIRHELAHYITFIEHGETSPSHGVAFRTFCQRMGWGEEIYRATLCLEGAENATNREESSIFRKVQKLMALTTSSNKNEAEQAMIKSQQLLLRHNLESNYIEGEDGERMFLKRILKQKKINAKMRAIANILETFFVSTVYNRTGEFTYLEILGSAVNIEIAEYVATVLQSELETLWDQAQRQANLKGAVAKNSFFVGLARGYCNKIQALKRDYTRDVTQGLIVIEKKLVEAKAMAYQRLTPGRSSGSYCHESSALGEQMGRQLNINPALNRSSKNSDALIGYSAAHLKMAKP